MESKKTDEKSMINTNKYFIKLSGQEIRAKKSPQKSGSQAGGYG